MTKSWYRDTVERVLWTFLQGAVAELLVSQSLDIKTLQVAAVAGAVSAAKCVMATQIGSKNTAATLSTYDDTPEGGHG